MPAVSQKFFLHFPAIEATSVDDVTIGCGSETQLPLDPTLLPSPVVASTRSGSRFPALLPESPQNYNGCPWQAIFILGIYCSPRQEYVGH